MTLDNITLYKGDCRDTLRNIIQEGIRVDLIIADLPYGINYESDISRDNKRFGLILNDNIFMLEIIPILYAILKFTGAMYFFTRWDVYHVWFKCIKDNKFTVKNCLIWDKCNWTAGDLPGNYSYQYEQILFLTKGNHGLNGTRKSNLLKYSRGYNGYYTHPTEKPLELMRFLINKSTNKGDLVLDPTMGSGVVGEACKLMQRKFIGIELEDNYFNIAEKRINGIK